MEAKPNNILSELRYIRAGCVDQDRCPIGSRRGVAKQWDDPLEAKFRGFQSRQAARIATFRSVPARNAPLRSVSALSATAMTSKTAHFRQLRIYRRQSGSATHWNSTAFRFSLQRNGDSPLTETKIVQQQDEANAVDLREVFL